MPALRSLHSSHTGRASELRLWRVTGTASPTPGTKQEKRTWIPIRESLSSCLPP